MALLKEDGSLDIERINKLPLEEHMKEISSLTSAQYKEYVSSLPLNESDGYRRVARVSFTLKEALANGAVIAKDFINKIGRDK